jgi:hypothetical protein
LNSTKPKAPPRAIQEEPLLALPALPPSRETLERRSADVSLRLRSLRRMRIRMSRLSSHDRGPG